MRYQVQINDKVKSHKSRIKLLEKDRTQLRKDKELPKEIIDSRSSTISKEIRQLQKELNFLERKGLKLVKLSNGDIYDLSLVNAYISKLGDIRYSVFVSPGVLTVKMDEANRKGQIELLTLKDHYGEFDIPVIDEAKELNAIEDFIC